MIGQRRPMVAGLLIVVAVLGSVVAGTRGTGALGYDGLATAPYAYDSNTRTVYVFETGSRLPAADLGVRAEPLTVTAAPGGCDDSPSLARVSARLGGYGFARRGLHAGSGPLAEIGPAGNPGAFGVHTRHGVAVPATTPEVLALRAQVQAGAPIYRAGNFPRSAAAASDAQFFSPSNPLTTPDFANAVGAANLGSGLPDFVMGTHVAPGGLFVTRYAPAVGSNVGGALEVVTPRGGFVWDFFSMVEKF